MSERYLLVKHSEGWNVDRCCRWMQSNNKAFDWFYPLDEEPFPQPSEYTGVIVFGGAPSANDEHAWVRPELEFIEQCLAQSVGFFGICLGAQMLARVLGANVAAHPDGLTEIGQCDIEPTEQGRDFLPAPMTVMQWHREGFDLPSGAVSLARSELFEHQAFCLNERVYGVQYHPEVNPESLAIWHERNKTRPTGVLTDEQRTTMMHAAKRHDATVTAWLDGFLSTWCAVNLQPPNEAYRKRNG